MRHGGIMEGRGDWVKSAVRRLLPLVALAVMLGACANRSPAPAASTVAAIVNREPVPLHLYSALVAASRRKVERAGIAVNWNAPDGADRLNQIEAQALKQLVRNAVIEQLARTRRVAVSAADLDAAMGQLEEGFGGAEAFDQKLEQEGLSREDFRALLRPTLAERTLRVADPAGYEAALERALQRAKVQAYVGPCATNHQYPRCAEAP